MAKRIRNCIIEYQRANNIPDWQMCNILGLDESEWNKFAHGYGLTLTTFQKIAFVEGAKTPLPM